MDTSMRYAVLLIFVVPLSVAQEEYSPEFFTNILNTLSVPLSPKCHQQFEKFIANLNRSQNSWAFQMVDANSDIPVGLVSLKFEDMGDFQQCIDVKEGTILGKYCLGYISSGNTSFYSASLVAPVWALCLPNGCTTDDTNTIGNAILASLIKTKEIGVSFSDLLCQTVKDAKPELTNAAIGTIVVLAVLLFIVLSSTFYDIYCVFYSSKSCPLVAKAFSVYTNGKHIFKMGTPNTDHLPCLDGLRFFSMMWVVIYHQYSVPMSGSIASTKNLTDWPDKIHTMFIISGTVAVDTFLTIGGTLMSFGFMKARHKKVSFNLFHYYIHRYLRLTAALALVVLVSGTLLMYMGSGPKWPFLVLYFQKNCEQYWWSALLYVQNYVNNTKMCIGQTWYNDIDMQLYIISPIVFFALWKYPKLCIAFLSLCGLTSIGLSFYEAWEHHLPANPFGLYSGDSTEFQIRYYLLTHTRATPWIIGVILGYFIFKIKGKGIGLNKYVVMCLWLVCFGTLLACVLGSYSTFHSYESRSNAFHIALVRPAWSLAIAWIILACANDYGGPINWVLSLPIHQVFNRFTYSIYLTHVTLLFGIAFSRKTPDNFSAFNQDYDFWGTLWFCTGLAILLVFLAEAPVTAIEKMFVGKVTKERKHPQNELERGIDNTAFQENRENNQM